MRPANHAPEDSVSRLSHRLRPVIVLLWLAVFVFIVLNRKQFTLQNIMDLSPSAMLPAALFMLVLYALKSVSVIIYCGILFAATGVLFPLYIALPVSLAGTLIMISLPYALGRLVGQDGAKALLKKYPKLADLQQLRTRNGVLFPFVVQATGILPSDPFSMYMGAAGASYGKYLLGSLLGYLFDMLPYTIMGYSIEDPDSPVFLTALAVRVIASAFAIGYGMKKRKAAKADSGQAEA